MCVCVQNLLVATFSSFFLNSSSLRSVSAEEPPTGTPPQSPSTPTTVDPPCILTSEDMSRFLGMRVHYTREQERELAKNFSSTCKPSEVARGYTDKTNLERVNARVAAFRKRIYRE